MVTTLTALYKCTDTPFSLLNKANFSHHRESLIGYVDVNGLGVSNRVGTGENVARLRGKLEKGQRISALVSGSWPYSEDFKALSRTVSHLTSEETCLTTHSSRPEERESV